MARQMLSSTLVGVCSQRLVPAAHGGMALNAEVLVNSPRMRGLIRGEATQEELRNAVAEGEFYGMRTFDQCLFDHVMSGRVKEADALESSRNEHDFKLMLDRAGGAPAPGSAPAAAEAITEPVTAPSANGMTGR